MSTGAPAKTTPGSTSSGSTSRKTAFHPAVRSIACSRSGTTVSASAAATEGTGIHPTTPHTASTNANHLNPGPQPRDVRTRKTGPGSQSTWPQEAGRKANAQELTPVLTEFQGRGY